MKDSRNYLRWIKKAIEFKLTLTEMQVFLIWFDDNVDYSSGATKIHKNMPHVKKHHIRRAFKGIKEKGLLIETGTFLSAEGNKLPFYSLNYSLLEVVPEMDKVVPEMDKVVPEMDKVVPEMDKVVPEMDKVVPEMDKVVPEMDKVVPEMVHGLINNLLNPDNEQNKRLAKEPVNNLDKDFVPGLSDDRFDHIDIKSLYLRIQSGEEGVITGSSFSKNEKRYISKELKKLQQQLHPDPKG